MAELDLFLAPMTQLSIDEKLYTELYSLYFSFIGHHRLWADRVFHSRRQRKIFGFERYLATPSNENYQAGQYEPG